MSLYTTGFYIRRFTAFFFIFIGILISLGIIGTITKRLTDNITQSNPETSSVGFGNITPIKIKQSSQSDVFKPSYFSVDTDTGALPDFQNALGGNSKSLGLVNVYQVDFPPIQVDSRQKGIDLSDKLIFKSDPKISDKDLKYEWSDGKRTLLYNVDTKTFEMFTSNIASLDVKPQYPGSISASESFFKSFFQDLKINTDESLSYIKSDYVKYNYNSGTWDIVTVPVNNDQSTNNSPSNFIRVSYMRKTRSRGKDPLPTSLDTQNPDPTIVNEYYPGFDYSPVYMILKNNSQITVSDIVELSYYKYDYDITRPQTYKPKSIQASFDDVQKGKGTLVKISNDDNSPISNETLASLNPTINVKKVSLGYYLSNARTDYVLPVYVYECDFVISTQGITQKKGTAVYYDYAFENQ